MRRSLIIVVALVSLSAWTSGCNVRSRPDSDEIRFDHGAHIAEGQGCPSCHVQATFSHEELEAGRHESADERHALLPSEAFCRACHDEGEEARCGFCHTNPRHPETYAEPSSDIIFDHAIHEEAQRGRCMSCHGPSGAGESTLVRSFVPVSPGMDRCTDGCHTEEMAQLRCEVCHTDLHRYGVGDVSVLGHAPGWVQRHGPRAGADRAACATCHEPTFCEECHQNAQGAPLEDFSPLDVHRDFVHRGDFIARHGVEVGLERGTCVRCHGIQFCDGCHQASGVGGSVAPGSPHPPGWLDPMSVFGHAAAARRDLLACASCHESDAEQTCVPCHRVGGVASSPHPPGFGMGMDNTRHAVCRVCHVP